MSSAAAHSPPSERTVIIHTDSTDSSVPSRPYNGVPSSSSPTHASGSQHRGPSPTPSSVNATTAAFNTTVAVPASPPPPSLHPLSAAHLDLLHAGNTTHLCMSRIMGPGWQFLLGTWIAILLPSGVYLGTTAPDYMSQFDQGWIVLLLFLLFFITTLIFLLDTSTRDPGIFLRLPPDPTFKWHPITQDVILNGRHTMLKYCSTCNIYRPPRCVHW